MSDEQIHKDQEKALKDARLRYLDKIVQIKDAKKKLNKLLLDAQLWEPPTEKHNVVKKFMIDELKNTIGYDCDLKPVNELIEDIEGRLASIDVEKIREDQVRAFNQQIEFHEQSYKVDKEHVGQSNEWVNQLVKSFEKTKLNIVK